jgi:hypothetical protein
MCSYATVQTTLEGSAKGPDGMAEHTLNIDLADPSKGPSARVAVELTAASARDLIGAIQAALAFRGLRRSRSGLPVSGQEPAALAGWQLGQASSDL